jgi:WD40 repeat protein
MRAPAKTRTDQKVCPVFLASSVYQVASCPQWRCAPTFGGIELGQTLESAKSETPLLTELFSVWQQERDRGTPVTPQELCANNPELLAPLQRKITALESMLAFVAGPDSVPVSGQPTRLEGDSTASPVRDRGASPPTVQLPGYEILGILGRGGMGIVYQARHLQLKRLVALKMIRAGDQAEEAELARFRVEAEAVARLQHPSIVQIYEVGEHQGQPFCCLEFVGARKELQTPKANKDQLRGPTEALFTSDGKIAATVHGVNFNPGLVVVWDLDTGQQLWQEGVMGFFDRGLWPLGFLPTGETLVVLDKATGRISLREAATGKERRAFDTMPLRNARMWRLSPDGKTVALGTDDAVVRVWDVTSGKELPSLSGHQGQARAVAFGRDGKTVLTGGSDPFVLVWDWPAGKLRRKLDLGDTRGIENMDVSADGKRAEITIWGERALRFYDLKTGKELPPAVEAHRGPVYGMVVTSNSQLVSAGLDNTIRIWDLRTGRHLRAIRTDYPVGASTLAVSADGRLIATADFNLGQVVLHERDTGKVVRTIETGGRMVSHVAFAPTGSLLAVSGDKGGTGGSEPFLAFWDADNGREIRRQTVARASAIVFSPDGRSVAALAKDELRLWDVATGRQQLTLAQKEPLCVALSADGRTLACGDHRFKSVTLWELASGKERGRIEAPAEWCQHLSFSPDGRWLARHDRNSIQLWDVHRNEKVHTFAGHDEGIMGLSFTPDSRTLISSSLDTTLLVWDLVAVRARQTGP